MHRYDVIFHLAGISGFPACASNPHSAQLINVEATQADSEGPVTRPDTHKCLNYIHIRKVRFTLR